MSLFTIYPKLYTALTEASDEYLASQKNSSAVTGFFKNIGNKISSGIGISEKSEITIQKATNLSKLLHAIDLETEDGKLALLLLTITLMYAKSNDLRTNALPKLIELKPDFSGQTGGFYIGSFGNKAFRSNEYIRYTLSQSLSSYSDQVPAIKTCIRHDLSRHFMITRVNHQAIDRILSEKTAVTEKNAIFELLCIWKFKKESNPGKLPLDIIKIIVDYVAPTFPKNVIDTMNAASLKANPV